MAFVFRVWVTFQFLSCLNLDDGISVLKLTARAMVCFCTQ